MRSVQSAHTAQKAVYPANYESPGGGGIDLSFVRVADDPDEAA